MSGGSGTAGGTNPQPNNNASNPQHKRVHSVKPTLIAVRCSSPGRVCPTTKVCVNEKVQLRFVLSAWASGVMKSSELPEDIKVFGRDVTKCLDLDATFLTLRPLLPVKEGRLTISVVWPQEQLVDQAQQAIKNSVWTKPTAQNAGTPKLGVVEAGGNKRRKT